VPSEQRRKGILAVVVTDEGIYAMVLNLEVVGIDEVDESFFGQAASGNANFDDAGWFRPVGARLELSLHVLAKYSDDVWVSFVPFASSIFPPYPLYFIPADSITSTNVAVCAANSNARLVNRPLVCQVAGLGKEDVLGCSRCFFWASIETCPNNRSVSMSEHRLTDEQQEEEEEKEALVRAHMIC